MELKTIGIDLAKTVFQVHGVDHRGKAVLRKRLSRSQLSRFVSDLSPCLIGMEACSGAHFWARQFRAHGHTVKLIAPQFVKPYVKSNKNDAADAEAICEAVARPNMRFVPIKEIAQHDIQCLHRVRERLVSARTALINETRGLLAEYGYVLPAGKSHVRGKLMESVGLALEQSRMTTLTESMFTDLLEELQELEARIGKLNTQIENIHKNHPVSQRLAQIPGVGPMTATALVAAVGDAKEFKNGRQLSAWLGLVPKQHSSGGKEQLLGISKRGDKYIRKLLIHGARAEMKYLEKRPKSRHTQWLMELEARRGTNRAVVALANKNARRAWVMMVREVDFDRSA